MSTKKIVSIGLFGAWSFAMVLLGVNWGTGFASESPIRQNVAVNSTSPTADPSSVANKTQINSSSLMPTTSNNRNQAQSQVVTGNNAANNTAQTQVNNPRLTPTPSPSQTTAPTPQSIIIVLNASEVAKHVTASDCWEIINGAVYNVTSFIPVHPGGQQAVIANCGTDATAVFNANHSPGAINSLQPFLIGNLGQTIATQGSQLQSATNQWVNTNQTILPAQSSGSTGGLENELGDDD